MVSAMAKSPFHSRDQASHSSRCVRTVACAVIGLPDDKWGERVVVVVQPHAGAHVDPDELTAFVKQRIGSVKAPKEVHVWPDLPRSKVGKVLKTDIKSELGPAPAG